MLEYFAQDCMHRADADEEVQIMTELPQGVRKEMAPSLNIHFFHAFSDNVLATIASHMAPL